MRWLEVNGNPLPPNKRTKKLEKSLFSQLKGSGSFGAKVARRLERDYEMGDGYLDAQEAVVATASKKRSGDGLAASLKLTIETAGELRLITVYRLANERGRGVINDAVDAVQSRLEVLKRANEP